MAVKAWLEGHPFDLDEVAPKVLERVNGLGRLHNPSYRPVKLSGRYQDGDRRHTVVVLGTAEARCGALAATVVVNDADVARPPSPSSDRLQIASTHPDTTEALALTGQPQSLNRVELWKVFEIVRENIKPITVEFLGWPTVSDVKVLTASATARTSAVWVRGMLVCSVVRHVEV